MVILLRITNRLRQRIEKENHHQKVTYCGLCDDHMISGDPAVHTKLSSGLSWMTARTLMCMYPGCQPILQWMNSRI